MLVCITSTVLVYLYQIYVLNRDKSFCSITLLKIVMQIISCYGHEGLLFHNCCVWASLCAPGLTTPLAFFRFERTKNRSRTPLCFLLYNLLILVLLSYANTFSIENMILVFMEVIKMLIVQFLHLMWKRPKPNIVHRCHSTMKLRLSQNMNMIEQKEHFFNVGLQSVYQLS